MQKLAYLAHGFTSIVHVSTEITLRAYTCTCERIIMLNRRA